MAQHMNVKHRVTYYYIEFCLLIKERVVLYNVSKLYPLIKQRNKYIILAQPTEIHDGNSEFALLIRHLPVLLFTIVIDVLFQDVMSNFYLLYKPVCSAGSNCIK